MAKDVETQMENNTETQMAKDVLAELCASAPSTTIRDCLRKFKFGKQFTYKEQYNSIFPCQKNVIVDTLEYLCCVNEWKQTLKPQCVHELVCRIQTLLPDNCEYCNSLYTVPRNQTSLLACAKCGQEAHRCCVIEKLGLSEDKIEKYSTDDVAKMLNPLELPGLVYLCKSCKESTVPHPDAGKITIKDNASRNRDGDNDTLINDNGGTPDRVHEIDLTRESEKSPKICSFFMKGKCKHGARGKECKFTHPPLCKKYMNYGNKDSRGCKGGCNKLHPKLCPKSLTTKGCDRNCSYFYHAKRLAKSSLQPTKPNDVAKNKRRNKHKNQSSTSKSEALSSSDFLEILQSLRADIIYEMDVKMATMMSLKQSQSQQADLSWQSYRMPSPRDLSVPLSHIGTQRIQPRKNYPPLHLQA